MRAPATTLIDTSSLLAILEVSRKLALPNNLTELLELILGTGCEVTGADRGTVFLYDAETKELYSRVATGRTQSQHSARRTGREPERPRPGLAAGAVDPVQH